MGIFKVLGFNYQWGKDRVENLSKDTNSQNANIMQRMEEIDPKVLDRVLKEISTVVAPVSSSGRQTIPDNKSLLQVLGDMMITQPDFDREWLRALNYLAMFHPDVSAAVDNVSLANTVMTTEFDESVSDSLAKEMMQVLTEQRDNWYPYGDGINGFVDDMLTQCATTGAISHEWLLAKNGRGMPNGIFGVAMVDPYNILFDYDVKKGIHVPVQKVPSSANYIGPTVLGQYKKLNTVTYRYSAMRRMGESPFAIPPYLAALENIAIQRNMVKNIAKIIEKLGVLGFLKVMLNAPTRNQGESDQQYYQRCKDQQNNNVEQTRNGLNNGFMIGFKGVQEVDMQTTNQNVSGAETLMDMNDRLVINGMKQPLEMMNRKNSSSETFGRVMLAKLSRQLSKYQTLVAGAISYGDLLHLRLMGYPVNKVINTFEPVMLGDKKSEAEAFGKTIDNATKLYEGGIISQLKRANMLGYDQPDQKEPRITASEDIDENESTDPTELPKKTAAENKRALKLGDKYSKYLEDSPETGMGYHLVDLQTNIGLVKKVVVTNCEYAYVDSSVKEITAIRLTRKDEAASFF